jgi:peptidoglycan hydrolase CwlO-like protein
MAGLVPARVASTSAPAIMTAQALLEEIDARQNALLEELDRLNSQIEAILQSCLGVRGEETTRLSEAAP